MCGKRSASASTSTRVVFSSTDMALFCICCWHCEHSCGQFGDAIVSIRNVDCGPANLRNLEHSGNTEYEYLEPRANPKRVTGVANIA